MHVVRSSPEAVDEEASAAAGSGTVKNEDEEEKEEEESKTDSEESPAPAPTDQEKRELQEGYNRCYAKRIFKLFADHRPTVPLDEVVETVEQCQHDLCGFYKSLCYAHGLVVGRPVWEPPDDNLDFLKEFQHAFLGIAKASRSTWHLEQRGRAHRPENLQKQQQSQRWSSHRRR